MRIRGRRRKSVIFFITLGVCLVMLAIALNVGWLILNGREVALLIFGMIFVLVLIFGLVLNTTFLIREIRRNEQHDAFINAVTHELKTPIASIRLYLETLKTREVDEDQRREFYNIMLTDSERLLLTVEQVLRAGRSGDKRRRIANSLINVSEMVQECLERTRVRYGLNETALVYSETPEAGSAKVFGDVDELRAAFSNLLDNAVKYSDHEVSVSVSLSALHDKRIALRVADTGIGIQSAQLKRIFKRFYRVPGRFMARVKGTGLGLFIVHSVITKHGGRVFAESPGLGHGSTFTVHLPITLPVADRRLPIGDKVMGDHGFTATNRQSAIGNHK
jgi:two-component system, OmpR family, sensor histidine kinase SenX3